MACSANFLDFTHRVAFLRFRYSDVPYFTFRNSCVLIQRGGSNPPMTQLIITNKAYRMTNRRGSRGIERHKFFGDETH